MFVGIGVLWTIYMAFYGGGGMWSFCMCWLEHVDMRFGHVSTALLGIVCNLGLGMGGPLDAFI